MTREQYDELSAPLVRVLLDMEDDILREIAAQLSRDGDISDTSKWRIRQLARAGRFDKRAAAIIAGYAEVEDGQAMDAVIAAAETEIGYLDNAVQAANAAGITEYFSDVPAEESALGAAKAFQRQAASDLNLVNTVMRYKAGSAYVNAVNAVYNDANRQDVLDVMGKGAAKAVSGQMSLQEATRKTIRELAQKGIPAFVDKRGREWSPEAYVMMDMRSTLANTARAAQDTRCDEYGIKLIEISSHLGARPKCAIDQGKIYSRDGTSGVTTDGAGNKIPFTPFSKTSYGQPDGILGINCGHVQYPFAPGINFQRYFPYPKEENDKRYREFQQQRAMERNIRAAKRECMMLQETGDTEGLQKASLRLRTQKEKYSAYCKETGLRQHNDRTQVYGYDRSKSSKTVWAERKAKSSQNSLTSGGISGMINIGSELPMNALTRKAKPDDYVEPMPKKQFQRICKSFKSQGGIIQMSDATDEYLNSKHAEAITYDSKTILLKQNPSRASVFEEFIHTHQYKTGENDGSYESRLKCEISAQKKLIKYSKAYKLTDTEITQTQRALEAYENELKEYYKNGGA